MAAKITAVILAGAALVAGPRLYRLGKALNDSRRALDAGRPGLAANHLAEAARLLPSQPRLWEQAGHYALQANEPEAAIQFLQQAGQALSEAGILELAGAYQQTGDLASATGLLEELSNKATPDADLLVNLLALHRQAGDFPAALEDLRRLVALKPADAQLRYQLGLLTATQDPEAALAHLARAAELDPGLGVSVEALRQKISTARLAGDPGYLLVAAGQALASQGEWALAAEAFYHATLQRPDYAEAWSFLGEARQHLETKTASPAQDPLLYLQKALELDPQSLSAHTFLALYWSRQGDYDRALAALRAAIRLEPANPALQIERGNLLALSGDLDAAQQAFQHAIELTPGETTAVEALVDFSIRYDYRLNEIALSAARQLVAGSPGRPEALDRMAQVLIKLNDLTSAERFLLRAIQADSRYALAHLHLGLLYSLRGESAAAAEELEQARALAPDSPVADQAARLLETYFP